MTLSNTFSDYGLGFIAFNEETKCPFSKDTQRHRYDQWMMGYNEAKKAKASENIVKYNLYIINNNLDSKL